MINITHVVGRLFYFIALTSFIPAYAQDDSWKSTIGDPQEINTELREEIIAIRQIEGAANANRQPLVGTLYQPKGDGPFPVIVLSHGSPGRSVDRKLMGRYRLIPQIRALVEEGFAVIVPMRRGYGESMTSDYAESYGYCQEPRYDITGIEGGRDIRATVEFILSRSSLKTDSIVLMGQSAGGFASIAAASLGLKGVVAVINMAGGRGGNGIDGLPCRPDRMAQTITNITKTLRVPVLWFYVENDKYFAPSVVRTWYSSFESAGGNGKLIIHPPYGQDGHLFFYKTETIPTWITIVRNFIRNETSIAF